MSGLLLGWLAGCSTVLSEDGLLVFETAARTEPELPGLLVRTTRKYGSTRVTVFEHEA